MGKELRCGDLVPGCAKVIHGKDESEVMSQASAHATNDHKLTVTPELAEKVRKAVRDSWQPEMSPNAAGRSPRAARTAGDVRWRAAAREDRVMKGGCGLLVGAALVLHGATARAQELFDLQKVADGVYAALARPRTPINCNAAVVVYDDGVLVMDTHSRPSSARALIRQVEAVTDKPVRYAVNSHFHWDHAQGNRAYPVAFPKQVAIVASEATRENLRALGMQRVKEQIENGPRQIDVLKKRIAVEKETAAAASLRDELRQQEEYLAEIRSLELVLPDVTFDRSMILHRSDRDIVLLFLGRGHTSGDVVAYLPKQRVVATGDLLHGWMPFMGDAFPKEWVATLDALDKLDFDHIIGGHGGVKPKAHLRFFRNYIADLIEEVGRARQRGETLEQAQRSAASALQPKYEAGMDGRFAGSIGANIEKVYKDMAAGLY